MGYFTRENTSTRYVTPPQQRKTQNGMINRWTRKPKEWKRDENKYFRVEYFDWNHRGMIE